MPEDETGRKQLLEETGDALGAEFSNDIYALRTKALDEPLQPYHIGRVLFSLNQRRGYKSNRKADAGEIESKIVGLGIKKLDATMSEAGARTYGEYLHLRRCCGEKIRVRLSQTAVGSSRTSEYEYFPSRKHLEKEFDAICFAQARFRSNLLSPEVDGKLRQIIFYQRPLKAISPGRCSVHPEEECLPRAHPLFQDFDLLNRLNELTLAGKNQASIGLDLAQREVLRQRLAYSKNATFESLRRALNLADEVKFHSESEKCKKLVGSEFNSALSHSSAFGSAWKDLSNAERWVVVEKLWQVEDPDVLKEWLRSNTELDENSIDVVLAISVPTGFCRFGRTALCKLVDELQHFRDQSDTTMSEKLDSFNVFSQESVDDNSKAVGREQLPKYQEVLHQHIPAGSGNPADPYDVAMGRITNPTLHIALNQLRRVVNTIIARHGKPDRISVQLARNLKLSHKPGDMIRSSWTKTKRLADETSQKVISLEELDTSQNRIRLKLWEELPLISGERVCVYTGLPIYLDQIFSEDIAIDHILPYSRTLDDSQSNRILCLAKARRLKTGKSPAEVAAWRSLYDEILERASILPKNKRLRFSASAMNKFDAAGGIQTFHLSDQTFCARMCRAFLNSLYLNQERTTFKVFDPDYCVQSLPGRLTEKLRRDWNLNALLPDHAFLRTQNAINRRDFRHDAVDAAVIACTSPSLVKELEAASVRLENEEVKESIGKVGEPWAGFHDQLKKELDTIVVSHKSDHGTFSVNGRRFGLSQTAGRLHNDTAYGFVTDGNSQVDDRIVYRKKLENFSSEKHLDSIRDLRLRQELRKFTLGLSGREFTQAILSFSRLPGSYHGMRRIRVVETAKTIPIPGPDGKFYKGYKGGSNFRYDVWELTGGKWVAEVVSTFAAHQVNYLSPVRLQHSTARKVLSVKQNDMVAYEDNSGETVIARVVKFSANGQLSLATHYEAGDLKRRDALPSFTSSNPMASSDAGSFDPFKYLSPTVGGLKERKIRQVRVDELGAVSDPGPRNRE